jgi:hypothetical protein
MVSNEPATRGDSCPAEAWSRGFSYDIAPSSCLVLLLEFAHFAPARVLLGLEGTWIFFAVEPQPGLVSLMPALA